MAHEAAGQIHEPFELALRVVEPPGTGPAIGAGKDTFVAQLLLGAVDRVDNKVERPVPADWNIRVAAAA